MSNYNENRHPNRPTVQEEDFSKISKQYILQGQYLKVRGIFDMEHRKQPAEMKQKQELGNIKTIKTQQIQSFDDEMYFQLEYLQQLGGLSQQQLQILQQMRFRKGQHHTNAQPNKQLTRPLMGIGRQGYLPHQDPKTLSPYLNHQEHFSSLPRSSFQHPFVYPTANYNNFDYSSQNYH